MRIKPLYALRHRRTGKLFGGQVEIDKHFMLKLKEPAHITKISKGAVLVFDCIEAAQYVLDRRNRKLYESGENPEKFKKEIEIVRLKIEKV